jgi:hypothetical protein
MKIVLESVLTGRRVEVSACVDGQGSHTTIPPSIAVELGLDVNAEPRRPVLLADGSRRLVSMVGPCHVSALVKGTMPMVGHPALAMLEVTVRL